jgi:hypothetical protein
MILNGKNIHFHCTKHTKNTKLCWFQYRIIHRILGTNTFLYKIKVKDCNLCTFCKEEPETIEHLLWGCHKVSDLWHELNRWIFEMTYIEIPLNLEIAMFGLLHPYDANLIKNKIILLTKFYIFRTKVNEEMVNFEALKNYLKENLILEKHISFKNLNPEKIQYVLESLLTYNGTLINIYIVLRYCFLPRILLINSAIFTLILYVFGYGFTTFAVKLYNFY